MTNIKVAIAGNPNSGKTTVFNALTGSHQHVGNYSGVTVEKVSGSFRYEGFTAEVVDLPGAYSLNPRSLEERVAKEQLISSPPDVVVNILDASNLERNLYLTTEIAELGIPMVLVLNMSDRARIQGQVLDIKRFGELTNTIVIETVGPKGAGVEDIKKAIISLYRSKLIPNRPRISSAEGGDEHDRLTFIAESRYGYIAGLYHEIVLKRPHFGSKISDAVDSVVVNRFLGLPLFFFAMYLVFYATFKFSSAPTEWIQSGLGFLSSSISAHWPVFLNDTLRSLIVDGVIGGVGGVVAFLPNILMLFLAIAVLEDTGYMARAAFIMDRLMHKIGLHGRSFIPLLLGFGCSVPAIMATRTIEERRDRITTILILPLMSCGARLPIYSLLIPAFFPEFWRAKMLWLIYMIGVGMAVLLARLLRSTLLKGPSSHFVMELPPYRLPTFRGLVTHMITRTWLYIKKAGTIILAISIVMWFLNTHPGNTLEESYSGQIGKKMESVMKPVGLDWKVSTALVGAFVAKEVFVSQMGIIYSMDDEGSLSQALQKDYTPLQGFCIMLFCLIAMPCSATLAVTRKETGSWKWALLQFFGLTALAYLVTLLVYQVGVIV